MINNSPAKSPLGHLGRSRFAGKILIPLAFALLAAGCSSSQPAATTPTPQPMATSPTPANAAVKTINITGLNFSFTPSSISVKKGDIVKIVFTNSGTYPHNFMLDEFNARTKTVQPGQSDTVQFVADKTGTFQFYCSVPTHKDKGMVGTLVVQ